MNRLLNGMVSLCRAVMVFAGVSVLLMACSDPDSSGTDTSGVVSVHKVAVIGGQEELKYLQRTARWALDNITLAQRGMDSRVELQLMFKNQDDDDFGEYVKQLVEDSTVVAIIGPSSSSHATEVANALCSRMTHGKPLITPACTDLEFQRKFSKYSYVINMAESDIALIETQVSGIASRGYYYHPGVTLLTNKEDMADDTYVDWFAFIAEEYGLKVENVFLYETEEDVRRYVHELCGTDWHYGAKFLVFDPLSVDIALAFDDEIRRMRNNTPNGKYFYAPTVFCSDAFVSKATAATAKNTIYEGVELYSDPESGFGLAYRQRFGEEIRPGEAQFYDALCLIAYGMVLSEKRGISLSDGICGVMGGKDGKGGSWLPDDMAMNFRKLAVGTTPDINGVSGKWSFREDTQSCASGSTFRRWILHNGQFVTTEYVSTEGSRRSSSAKNMWEWTGSSMYDFGNYDDGQLQYEELNERWALLVAASSGWANYRFQSDVFAIYKLLIDHGYKDDHIVLVCEDDLAYDHRNPYQGKLFVDEKGDNVYCKDAIDYRLSSLKPSDIGDILQGRDSERLPHVIEATENDNVFVFWSGHGTIGKLDFGGSRSVSYNDMRHILEVAPHRKMLFAVEACYSGGLGEMCQGVPGLLLMTASNAWEPSHADVWSEQMGVYLSNGFTHGFMESIKSLKNNHSVSIRDLYYTLAIHTHGSHVNVYNVQNYGNVYTNKMTEFFQ